MENSKKLDDSVSFLKCLGILAVVFGHIGFNISGNGSKIHAIIYFYHMPLFFFISGYLYKSYKIKDTIIKNIRGLYIPFILWSCFFIAMRNVFIDLGFYNYQNMDNFSNMIKIRTFIDVFSFRYTEPMLGAMWFIPCLFIVRMLYAILNKMIDRIKFISDSKDILLPFIITILFIVGINYGISGKFLRYKLDVVFVAMFFYYIGVKYKELKEFIPIKFTIAIPLFLLMCQNIKFGFIDMNNRSYVNSAFFLFNSLSGIYVNLALIRIIKWIKNEKIKNISCVIGQSTFWILALHFVVFKIITLVNVKINDLSGDLLQFIFPGDVIGLSWIWISIYFILGVIVPVIIKLIIIEIKNKLKALVHNN